jgi:segregation and condensation protein A
MHAKPGQAQYSARVTSDAGPRLELPQFSGPLELLLHLLDEEELSIEGIEVARVCDRFLDHLAKLERIDIDAAGEFLVMASTLMRLKSQSLLPAEERILEDEELDPRFELVRQLVEYRRFRRAAESLDARREAFAQRLPRGMHPERSEPAAGSPPPEEAPIDAGGATVEQLFAAFARLIRQTEAVGWVIAKDDTPMAVHMARLESLFRPGRRLRFAQLFEGPRTRAYVVGVFLALLELIKRGLVLAVQEEEFGEIEIRVHETPVAGAPSKSEDVAPGGADAPPPAREAPADENGAEGAA